MAEHSLSDHKDYIHRRVETNRMSHQKLSEELKATFRGERRFSVCSIEHFCQEKGIHKTSHLSDEAVECIVSKAVAKVYEHYYNYYTTLLMVCNAI